MSKDRFRPWRILQDCRDWAAGNEICSRWTVWYETRSGFPRVSQDLLGIGSAVVDFQDRGDFHNCVGILTEYLGIAWKRQIDFNFFQRWSDARIVQDLFFFFSLNLQFESPEISRTIWEDFFRRIFFPRMKSDHCGCPMFIGIFLQGSFHD